MLIKTIKQSNYLLFLMLFGLINIAGCGTLTKQVVLLSDQSALTKPTQVNLNTEHLSEVNVALVGLGYNGTAIANSMYQANTNAAMQPGYNPGAGLVGAFIGGAIMKSSAENAAIKQKNTPVQGFLDKVSTTDWDNVVSQANTPNSNWYINNQGSDENVLVMTVTPQLKISTDYRAFELVSLIEIRKSGASRNKNKQPLYQNYIHIHSAPLLKQNQTVTHLVNEDQSFIKQHLSKLIGQLDSIIEREFTIWNKQKRANKSQSIKFINDNKEYYERGVILETNAGYITYRTLRGEIKHIPFDSLS